MSRSYGWNFAVTPVTAIGLSNSITKYVPEIDEYYCAIKADADIQQKYIDGSFLYGIRSALRYRHGQLAGQVLSYDRKIKDKYEHLGFFKRAEVHQEIDALDRQRKELLRTKNRYELMIRYISDGFAENMSSIRQFGLT